MRKTTWRIQQSASPPPILARTPNGCEPRTDPFGDDPSESPDSPPIITGRWSPKQFCVGMGTSHRRHVHFGDVRNGYKITFLSRSPLAAECPSRLKGVSELLPCMDKLLAKNSVEEVINHHTLSSFGRLFYIPKPSGPSEKY